MAEHQLEALGKILNQVVDELYIFDTSELRLLTVSKMTLHQLGYTEEILLQKKMTDVQADFTEEGLRQLLAPLGSQQPEIHTETVHFRKNGTYYPVKVQYHRTSYLGQDVFVAVATDITEERRAAEEVERHQQMIESIADTSPELLYVFDFEQNQYVYFSNHIKNMLGYEVEEVLSGQIQLFTLLHPEDHQKVNDNFMKIRQVRDDEVLETIYRVQHRNGHWVWLSSRDKPFRRNAQGLVIQTVGTAQDITHQMQYEQKLEQQNQELKKANAELDRFVYSSSHDLRAPLASVLGLINLSLISSDAQEKDTYIRMMEESLNRLDRFIQDIIHYSRNSRMEVAQDEIDFQQLVKDTIHKLSYMKGMDKVSFDYSYDIRSTFISDQRRLAVIMSNLVGNAVRFQNPSADQPFINIRIQADAGEATLVVEDNGVGIASDYQDRVFDMFFKASHQNHGSGLGLYIVKETVNVLQGKVTFTSSTRQGTTFTVSVPNLKA
jgi:PAS domain S-box-containing protein